MPLTHNVVKPKGLLSLWAAFLAVVAVVAAGLFSPVAAYADEPTVKIGDITQNKSGDGKEVVFYNSNTGKYLVDNNGTLEWKSDTDADFDMDKATFTLRYVSTSVGDASRPWKNQQIDDTPGIAFDHYNVISHAGRHLTMGNENANPRGTGTLSLRDEAFFIPSNITDYWVNDGGNGAIPKGWPGYRIYSDRFSTNGTYAWFALNADNNANTSLSPKGLAGTGLDSGGIGVYEKPETATYTVTYLKWDDSEYHVDTVNVGEDAPAAPAGPTRPADDEYTYTFKEWVKQSEDADGNLVYKADYTATPKQAEPSPSPTTPSPSPTTPSPSPTTPSPSPTTPSPSPTTPSPSPTTPTPTPTEEPSTTTITVVDEDGDPVVGAKVTVVCGDKEVASYTTDGKENKTVVLEPGECTVHVDAPDGYEDPADTEVTPGEDTEITVKHSTYTVTYLNWKDKVVRKDTVRVDKTAPAAPAGPVRPADRKYTYEFKKWKKQSEDAKGNLVYKATYTKTLKPTTTIVVNDEDGNPVAGATVTVVCGDKEVASYTTDGKENKTVVLEPGECTVNVDAPEGYEDPEDTEVTPGEDTEITVKHSTYTVTYVDWKDKVVRKDTVRVDKTAPAAPAGPVRPADGKYTYEFKEWKKQSEDAKGNLVYKATYTKTLKPTTTVVVNDEDGNPVVGATVTVVCDGKEVASYTTDGTENKTVVLEPGECTVHVDAPDGYDDPADKPAVPGGNTEFTVEKTKQDVTVEIVDSKTGEKLDGKVDIYDSEGNKVATGVKSGDTVKLPKGEYTVEQSGDITGYNPAASEHFSVTNKAETVTLTAVAKPSQVVITVTDKDNHLPIDATATIVCGSLKQTVVAQNGKLVFNADTGTCTVTLSADGYKSDTLTLTIPGKGQSVARDAQLTREAIARGGLYGDEINGAKGNKNNVINKGNVNNPNVKAVPGSYGNGGGGSMLARTGGAVGGGLTAAAMLLLAGIFLVAKRRTES